MRKTDYEWRAYLLLQCELADAEWAKADARLTALFDALNQSLFDNQLPPYQVWLVPAGILKANDGRHFGPSCRILIADDLSEGEQEDTLKHEMVHAKTGDGHGARFRAELERLKRLGNPWAARALSELKPRPRNIRRVLLGMAEFDSQCPWSVARAKLAAAFGLSVRELLRLAPWVRKEWYRLTAQRSRQNEQSAIPENPPVPVSPPPFPYYSDDPLLNLLLFDHFSFLDD